MEDTPIDKDIWGDGPWQTEPDRCRWTDPGTDLICLVRRNRHLGMFCGYVGVPPSHPAYGLCSEGNQNLGVEGKDDPKRLAASAALNAIKVHGGLTFAGTAIGEPDDVYWFGFDCGHAFDMAPGFNAALRMYEINPSGEPAGFLRNQVYRDFVYVKNECCKLARQLALMEITDDVRNAWAEAQRRAGPLPEAE